MVITKARFKEETRYPLHFVETMLMRLVIRVSDI